MIPSVLLGNVRSTVVEYGLLVPGEEIMVAFSGGKDSLALALCLSELGYRVRSVAVDMGYDAGWAGRIRTLAAAAGFDVEVLDVRAGLAQFVPPPERREIRIRLAVLNELGVRDTGVVTPCTHCYNSKVIALDNVMRHAGKQKIAFGHHRTDACASLLKEALCGSTALTAGTSATRGRILSPSWPNSQGRLSLTRQVTIRSSGASSN